MKNFAIGVLNLDTMAAHEVSLIFDCFSGAEDRHPTSVLSSRFEIPKLFPLVILSINIVEEVEVEAGHKAIKAAVGSRFQSLIELRQKTRLWQSR